MNLLSNRFFYFSLFISIGAIAKAVRSARRKKRLSRIFSDRIKRSPEEFGTEFFHAESQQTARTLRLLLEKTLKIDLGGLLPGDSFMKDLKFDDMSRDSFQKFIVAVEGTFDIDLPPVAVCMKMTFDEMVGIVEKKRHRKTPPADWQKQS
jgi:hypothetical protein